MKKTTHTDPLPAGDQLPTVDTLALMAAVMARTITDDPKRLAGASLRLWLSSAETLQKERQRQAENKARAALSRVERILIPHPPTWPITREQFCRLVMPELKGRTADMASTYKDWLKHDLARLRWLASDQQQPPEAFIPSHQDVLEVFAEHGRQPLKDDREYIRRAGSFLQWERTQRKQDISAKRRAAAKRSHSNRNQGTKNSS